MTAAALRAIRTANALVTDCFYEVIDWTQGTTLSGPNIIQIHAVDGSTLDSLVDVLTPYDNISWPGTYDIDLGAVGTMTRLTDPVKNNVVTDNAGTTLGQFPWGNANFKRNTIDTSVLGVGFTTFAAPFTDNILRAVTSMSLSGTAGITKSTFLGGTYAMTAGRTLISSSTFRNSTLTKAGVQDLTFTDSDILSTTINTTGAGAAGAGVINRCRISNSTIAKSAQGGGTNNWLLLDSDIISSTITNSGGASLGVFRSNLTATTYNATGARGLQIVNSNITDSTVNMQRTNTTNSDVISGVNMSGTSTLTIQGGTDFGPPQPVVQSVSITGDSTVVIAGAGNSVGSGTVLADSDIQGQSTLNIASNGRLLAGCRIAANATVNTGAFTHQATVIELQGVTTLTAANTNRLRNKGFSDVI